MRHERLLIGLAILTSVSLCSQTAWAHYYSLAVTGSAARSGSTSSGSLDGSSPSLCEFTHQGLMHDEEFGVVFKRARMLVPEVGRFGQRDPIEYVDGMGLYQYVRTLAFRDPGGTCSKPPTDGDCPTPWKAGEGQLGQYGCYCGEGQAPGTPKPIDAMDTCCQAHDTCYGPTPPGPTPAAKAACDLTICQCATKVMDKCTDNFCIREATLICWKFCPNKTCDGKN